MPTAPKAAKLVEAVLKSGLISEEDLAKALGPEAPFLDENEATERLLQKKLLTPFQGKMLRAGVHKGLVIGPYKILDQLGRGGMGIVYLGEHQKLLRQVAIKVLPKDKTRDQLALERFYREARAVAALDHPNIVKAHDINEHDGVHYFVMEYVKGFTLQQYLEQKGPVPLKTAVNYIAQACQGLQHAHEKGMVHRDIKPGNLLVDRQGTLKILDLGLARCFRSDKDNLTGNLSDGAILGSVDYIAPEQALGSDSVDIRSDIYSLGATFFALVTGRPPFDGTFAQKLAQHQMKPRPLMHEYRTGVPQELSAIVARMMAIEQKDRYATPAEVRAALTPWLDASAARKTGPLPKANEPSTGEIKAAAEDMYAVWTSDTRTTAKQVTVEIDPAYDEEYQRRRLKKERAEQRRRKTRRMLWSAGIGGMLVPLTVLAAILIFNRLSDPGVQVAAAEGGAPSSYPRGGSRPPYSYGPPPGSYPPSQPPADHRPPSEHQPTSIQQPPPYQQPPRHQPPPGSRPPADSAPPYGQPSRSGDAATTPPPGATSPQPPSASPPPAYQPPPEHRPPAAQQPPTYQPPSYQPPPEHRPPAAPTGNDQGVVEGQQAPEINGFDLFGKPLRLSSYRRQVILLSFWTANSRDCRRLVPWERTLPLLLRGRPFVLLGVNNDKDPQVLLRELVSQDINWRSFLNNRLNEDPISKEWGVRTWPTLFLIDHKNVVRKKWSGGRIEVAEVDAHIEALLREAETPQ